MIYMLDTNICVFLIRGKHPAVIANMQQHAADVIAISSLTLAELIYGANRSSNVVKSMASIRNTIAPMYVLPFDEDAAAAYGFVRTHLEQQGTPIGPIDTLIAAHALSVDVTLVTHNTKEFERVPGLRLEDWY